LTVIFASATEERIAVMFVKYMVVSREKYCIKSCKFLEDFHRKFWDSALIAAIPLSYLALPP